MKRIFYFLTLGLLSSSITLAQTDRTSVNSDFKPEKNLSTDMNKTDKGPLSSQSKGNTLWSDDFSEGDANWSIGNLSGNSDNWVIGVGIAPSGDFQINPILSTTAANGFAMFDSDLLCSGNQNAWLANADPIDLGLVDNVSLIFETYYRDFQGSCFVETSSDGVTWGNTVEILALAVNGFSANPEIVQLPLAGIAGSSSAYFRFRYQGGCDYAWMVDDVRLVETPQDDIAIIGRYYDKWLQILNEVPDSQEYLNSEEDFEMVDNYEFSSYLQGQVRPLTFGAEVSNLGINAQTDVKLNVTFTGPDGVSETFESEGGVSVESGEEVYISTEEQMPAAFADGGQLGTYTVSFYVTSAEDTETTGNNTIGNKTFTVDSELIGNGSAFGGNYNIGEDVIWGSRITLEQPAIFDYIQFASTFSQELVTVPGEVVYLNVRTGSVHSDDGAADEILHFEEDEIPYVIEEDDIPTSGTVVWITVFLPEPLTLEPGVIHQGEVHVPAGDGNFFFMGIANNQEFFAGSLFDNVDPSPAPQGWYTLGNNSPLIRLGGSTVVGVNNSVNLDFKLSQNYPNPTTGNTRIDWELMVPAKNVRFSITDITGKTVYAKDLGDRPAGVQESMELDLNLAAGNYQYGLTIGNQRIVRKMVVVK